MSVHKPLLSAADVTDRSRAVVGWKCWLDHPERFTESDSDAHVLRRGMEPLI